MWLTNTISADTTLAPTVARGQSLPDRGYSYDPIDYCASNVTVTNCTLLLTNGVSVAGVNSGAFKFRSGKFISQGSPIALNRLTRCETVQEQPVVFGTPVSSFFAVSSGSAEIRLRFTDAAFLGGAAQASRVLVPASNLVVPWEMSHCQLRGIHSSIYANVSGIGLAWTNNIFNRCTLSFYQENLVGYYSFTVALWNNLFCGGTLSFSDPSNFGTWSAKDNLFDCDTLTKTGIVAADYNGYRTGLSSLAGSHNKTGLTMDYQGGPATNFFGVLGTFYYPASGGSLTQLINGGSRNAPVASLYHFTTTADQTPESSSVVDIGFHWAALDGNNSPLDSDSDGIWNILEDTNGDGTVNSGETNWQDAGDWGLKVLIARPRPGVLLP